MFSPSVVAQDKFIEMPTSSQALYLGMNADDDGIVSPKRVMRMIGALEDDLKILVATKFVIPFESGVLVIREWRVNNLIRRDWYRPTTFTEEKTQLKVTDSGAYILVNEIVPSSATQVVRKLGNNRAPLNNLQKPRSLK
jgi:hypothetical protein